MKNLFRSFYARLSAIFLLLVCALGAGCIVIAFNFTSYLFDEVEQLLNLGYAQSIAEEIQPLVSAAFDVGRIKDAIHLMMVLNPMVEIYLTDQTGKILAYFTHPAEKIVKERIDLAPVREFIARGGESLILGEDPRGLNRRKPFSAAALQMGGSTGYVYIILRGQGYDSSLAALRSSYYLRAAFITFLLAVVVTLILGLTLFFLLTRRLRALSTAVRTFQKGDLSHRAAIPGKDEIGTLGNTFNAMAASLEANVEKLRLAEQLRRELVANISHDLRSPLTSIRGYLETILLKADTLSREERNAYLSICLRNVTVFQNQVDDLFELTKLETKQIAPRSEPIQLLDLAQDVVLKLMRQAEESHLNLNFRHPESLPLVSADTGLLERVLTNLIENALRFTPPGGSVMLEVCRKETGIEIAVADTGRGIDRDDLPHIFERYYHAEKSGSRTTLGTGLGLAIAKQIVELHGATLHVESTPGKGTRFSFSLTPAASTH